MTENRGPLPRYQNTQKISKKAFFFFFFNRTNHSNVRIFGGSPFSIYRQLLSWEGAAVLWRWGKRAWRCFVMSSQKKVPFNLLCTLIFFVLFWELQRRSLRHFHFLVKNQSNKQTVILIDALLKNEKTSLILLLRIILLQLSSLHIILLSIIFTCPLAQGKHEKHGQSQSISMLLLNEKTVALCNTISCCLFWQWINSTNWSRTNNLVEVIFLQASIFLAGVTIAGKK